MLPGEKSPNQSAWRKKVLGSKPEKKEKYESINKIILLIWHDTAQTLRYKGFDESLCCCCDLIVLWTSGFLRVWRYHHWFWKAALVGSGLLFEVSTFLSWRLQFLFSVSHKLAPVGLRKLCFLGQSLSASLLQPPITRIPMRLLVLARRELMLWCRPIPR